MPNIFITLNPKKIQSAKKLDRISNFLKLKPILEKYLNCLSSVGVCYTTIPEYLNLNVEKIKSKLFELVLLLVG